MWLEVKTLYLFPQKTPPPPQIKAIHIKRDHITFLILGGYLLVDRSLIQRLHRFPLIFFYLFAKYGHIWKLLVQGSHNTSLGRAVGLCLKVIFTLKKKTNKQKLKFNSSCNVSVNLAFYVLDKIHLQPLFKDILLKPVVHICILFRKLIKITASL